jgi:PqqD family protein of HPr-rel-A system
VENQNPTIEAINLAGDRPNFAKVPENVRIVHGPDGATILDIFQGHVFRLNCTASQILQLLNQGLTESAIAEQLAHEFGIERTKAEADVHELLAALGKHGLVTLHNFTSLA